jgi:uncharacterized protein (DUF2267 family)
MSKVTNMQDYYKHIQQTGKLRTPGHAQRWSTAVLKTLGMNLDRSTKKRLAETLPAELADPLTRVFWLLHFRDTNLSSREFLNQVSRRSGNTDIDFARYPTVAVFGGLKGLIDLELSKQISQILSPEVRQLWHQA